MVLLSVSVKGSFKSPWEDLDWPSPHFHSSYLGRSVLGA